MQNNHVRGQVDLLHGGGGGGENSLRPYSQQRPMMTSLSCICCLGLTDNGHGTCKHLTGMVENMYVSTYICIRTLRVHHCCAIRPKAICYTLLYGVLLLKIARQGTAREGSTSRLQARSRGRWVQITDDYSSGKPSTTARQFSSWAYYCVFLSPSNATLNNTACSV